MLNHRWCWQFNRFDARYPHFLPSSNCLILSHVHLPRSPASPSIFSRRSRLRLHEIVSQFSSRSGSSHLVLPCARDLHISSCSCSNNVCDKNFWNCRGSIPRPLEWESSMLTARPHHSPLDMFRKNKTWKPNRTTFLNVMPFSNASF